MEMTQDQLDAMQKKAAQEAASAAIAEFEEKQKARDEEKSKNLRAEFTEAFEKARIENENKGIVDKETAERKFGRMAFFFAKAQGDVSAMPKLYKELAPHDKGCLGVIEKTLTMGAGTGGLTVPGNLSSDVIEYLLAETILDKLGVKRIPLPNGNLTMPRQNGTTTVGWVGEVPANQDSTEPTFDDIQFNEHSAYAYSLISNKLIRNSVVGMEEFTARDLREQLARVIDTALLYGTGSVHQPLGITKQAGIATYGSSSTAITADSMLDIHDKLTSVNTRMINVRTLMNPRMATLFSKLKDSNLQYYFRDEIKTGKLEGSPLHLSTTVSFTDTTTDYGDIIHGDFADLIVALAQDVRLEISKEATLVNSAGTVISAFQKDLTAIKITQGIDFGLRHPLSFVHAQVSAS